MKTRLLRRPRASYWGIIVTNFLYTYRDIQRGQGHFSLTPPLDGLKKRTWLFQASLLWLPVPTHDIVHHIVVRILALWKRRGSRPLRRVR